MRVTAKWDHYKTANLQGMFSKEGLRLVTFHPYIEYDDDTENIVLSPMSNATQSSTVSDRGQSLKALP